MAEITLIKSQDGALRPVTATDEELLRKWKLGQAVKVTTTQIKPRSLVYHKRYWGGLIELVYQYWEPTGGLIGSSEKSTLVNFANWLDRKGGNSGAVRRACRAFLTELKQTRAQRIEAPEKSKADLHRWLKLEAGYSRRVITPAGVMLVPLSINFNAMSQDEFEAYYKTAFSVAWKFILSRTFENEEQAQNAINQLLELG